MASDDPHLSDRAARAAKIIADPSKYKVCESCDSIVARRVPLCPNCNGYRFNDESDAVVAQATALSSRAQTTVTEDDLE